MNEIFILIDEEYGEAQAFWMLDDAKNHFEEIDSSKWILDKDDDSFYYHEDVEYIYIFKREIL